MCLTLANFKVTLKTKRFQIDLNSRIPMLWKVVGGPLPAYSLVLSRKASSASPPHHCLPPERRSKWSASLNFVSGVLLVRHNGRLVPVVPVHRHQICTTNPPTLLIQVLRGSKKTPEMRTFFSYLLPWSFFCCQQGCFWAPKGSTVLVQRRVRAAA